MEYFNLYYTKTNVLCNLKTLNNYIWPPTYFQAKIKAIKWELPRLVTMKYTNPICIDLSFSPITMEEWCLVLAKVNNSSTCALNPIPSCFVKKLILSMATPSLDVHHLFPLYWLLKFPNLNKQKQTLSNPHSLQPPFLIPFPIQPNSRAVYIAISSSSLFIHSNIQNNMASSPTTLQNLVLLRTQ